MSSIKVLLSGKWIQPISNYLLQLHLIFISIGPTEDIPVKVTGNVKNGFTAEFVPIEVGIHMILVEYNGVAVGGTPYYSKAYDNDSVAVSDIPRSSAGKTVTFAGMFFWYIYIFRPN